MGNSPHRTPDALPESISSICDTSLRQRAEEAWRAVFRLKGCILPWHQWVYRLKDTGDLGDLGENTAFLNGFDHQESPGRQVSEVGDLADLDAINGEMSAVGEDERRS